MDVSYGQAAKNIYLHLKPIDLTEGEETYKAQACAQRYKLQILRLRISVLRTVRVFSASNATCHGARAIAYTLQLRIQVLSQLLVAVLDFGKMRQLCKFLPENKAAVAFKILPRFLAATCLFPQVCLKAFKMSCITPSSTSICICQCIHSNLLIFKGDTYLNACIGSSGPFQDASIKTNSVLQISITS